MPRVVRLLCDAATDPALWFAVTGSLSAYVVGVYLFEAPPVPLITPDTLSYWSSFAIRPLGYTGALHAVYALSGDFRFMAAVQSCAYCLSVLALQAALGQLARNAAFAGVVALILLLYHALLRFSLYLLSEELFIACLVLHMAAAAWALAARSRIALLVMAASTVAIISLRPAGAFVLVATVIFCLLWQGNRLFALRWAVVPLIAGMAAFMALGLAIRGIAIDEYPGFATFAYVSYLYDGGEDVPPVADRIIRTFMERYKNEREQAKGVLGRSEYEANHFNEIAYGLEPTLSAAMPDENVSALLGRLAMETIRRHPLGFLSLAAGTFAGGVSSSLNFKPMKPETIAQYYREARDPTQLLKDTIGNIGSFDVETESPRYGLVHDYPLPQLHSLGRWRWTFVGVFWVIAMVCWWRITFAVPSALSFFTAYTALLTVGGFLVIAVSTVVIARYVEPLDATMIVTIACGVLEAARTAARLLRSRKRLAGSQDTRPVAAAGSRL